MPQEKLGVVVEEIRVKVDDHNVTVYATVEGTRRIVFKESKDKPCEERYGAIAIKFAPTKE